MRVENSLKQKKNAVEDFMDRIFSRYDSSPLIKAIRHSVQTGGKRYRPLLLLSTADYFRVEREESLPFACGLEIIHNYSLVHDDLPSMDNDEYRRGQPSCHKAFGEDIALLTGDSLLTLAFEIMAGSALHHGNAAIKINLIHEISSFAGIQGMIGGQLMDITVSPRDLSEDRLYDLIEKKTASLIIAAVRSGAILGNASPDNLKALTEYGRNIGLAFQIRDDIMDAEQDQEENILLRPNSVSVMGLEKACAKLKKHITISLRSLKNAGISSEELEHLASMLSI